MNKIYLILLFFIMLANYNLLAQTPKELLEKISSIKQNDTTKLKLYLKLSSQYTERQADSALKYSLIARKLAEQLKYQKFHIEALDYLGRAQVGKGLYVDALTTFRKQETLATDYAQKAKTIRNQGNVYIELGKQKEAIDAYLRSLDMAYLSKHQLTIKYAENAYKIYTKLNNIQGQATSLTILGGAYSESDNLTKAKRYIQDAYELNIRLGDKRQIYSSANNLSAINLELNNYSEALKLANTAVNGLRQLNIIFNLIGAYTNRGKIYIALKNLQKAENDIDSALFLCRTNKYKLQEKNAMEALALLRAAQGNHAEAFHTIMKSSKLNDSLLNETNSKQINELRTKYETEKKQAQIDLLNEKTKLQELNIYNKI